MKSTQTFNVMLFCCQFDQFELKFLNQFCLLFYVLYFLSLSKFLFKFLDSMLNDEKIQIAGIKKKKETKISEKKIFIWWEGKNNFSS